MCVCYKVGSYKVFKSTSQASIITMLKQLNMWLAEC